MGQPPCHNIKIQCGRHPVSQGKNNLLKPWTVGERRKTFVPIPQKMQISRLGHKQNEVEEPVLSPKGKKCNNNNPEPSNIRAPKPYIVVPYHQGLSESYKNICKKYGIEVHLKGGHTIKDLPMAPKDKDPLLKKSGVIYRYKCDRVDCDEEYIRESARNFEERCKEHLKAPSPRHDHLNISGHDVTIDNFSILGREDQNLLRTIKEALYIRVNNPSLNRNIGKYHLPHIWNEVLLNISELNLK